MITKRIEKLKTFLEEKQAVILFQKPNRLYFSGFASSAGTVIITKENAYLLVDFRYYEKAKSSVKNLTVILCEKLYFQLNEILTMENIKTVFLETETISISKFNSLKQALPRIEVSEKDYIENAIVKIRSIKDSYELDSIKKAQTITDNAFTYILDRIKVGRTEKEIALELEFFMRKNGADGIAFDTIAISGKNTSLPHGVPTDKVIEEGDFFTMDFGATYNGYCSDMTRTVAVGEVTEKQRFVYDTVLKAQTEVLKEIREGMVCKKIDSVARNIIYNSGFEGCFGHGLGHSVGLEIHESPSFNTRDETELQSGVIITVEPGIYLENEFGVRIEDMVYVTNNGCINLTKSPKELIIL